MSEAKIKQSIENLGAAKEIYDHIKQNFPEMMDTYKVLLEEVAKLK